MATGIVRLQQRRNAAAARGARVRRRRRPPSGEQRRRPAAGAGCGASATARRRRDAGADGRPACVAASRRSSATSPGYIADRRRCSRSSARSAGCRDARASSSFPKGMAIPPAVAAAVSSASSTPPTAPTSASTPSTPQACAPMSEQRKIRDMVVGAGAAGDGSYLGRAACGGRLHKESGRQRERAAQDPAHAAHAAGARRPAARRSTTPTT